MYNMYKWDGHWHSTMLLRATKEFKYLSKYWADNWLRNMVESYLDTRWYDKQCLHTNTDEFIGAQGYLCKDCNEILMA